LITSLNEWQFQNRCHQWLADIDRASTLVEYNDLKTRYMEHFVNIYIAQHPHVTFPRPHTWAYIQAHQHAQPHVALTSQESAYITSILNAAQPTGCDTVHSEVSYQEHLQFVTGSPVDILAHFDTELAWFIARMTETHSEEVYLRYKHGYSELIRIYQDEHHVNLGGHVTACPGFSN